MTNIPPHGFVNFPDSGFGMYLRGYGQENILGRPSDLILAQATKPIEENEQQNDLIEHELIDLVGSTTNVLIYCLLDNSPTIKFTRDSIREGIDNHVKSMQEEMGADSQHIARIQTGKAAVNYWIDRMVESGTFDKKHSKPVEFWIKNRYPRRRVNHMYKPLVNPGGWGL